MNIRTALRLFALFSISNAANAVVPAVCADAYQNNGAIPETSGCPFAAAGARVGQGSIFCTATSGLETYIPEYCGSLPEDNCTGASSQITSIIGNPINISTGHKLQQVNDYSDNRWSDVNLPLELTRYYNSNTAIKPGIFGIAWRSNFDRAVNVSGTAATVIRPAGGMKQFTLLNGTWTPNKYVTDKLVELKDGAGTRTGWQYNTEDKIAEQYDVSGLLISIANRHGSTLTLSYQNGKLYRITDQSDRFLEFSYNANGAVESMTDPSGQIYSYTYDVLPFDSSTRPRLKSVSYPDKTPSDTTDNPVLNYLYGEDTYVQQADADSLTHYAYHLTGIIDENGDRYASFGFDHAGRANLTVHGTHDEDNTIGPKDNANRMDVVYNVVYGLNSTSWRAQTFNAQDKQTNYAFNVTGTLRRASTVTGVASPNCAASNSAYTFDANGFSDRVTDWNGNVTDYTINTIGLETSRIEALGKPEQRTVATDWYADLRLPEEIREEGRTVNFTYENGRIKTRIETDTTTHTVPYSTNGRTRQWTYTYTYHDAAQSQVASVSVNGPRTDVNDTQVYRYNTRGWLTESTNALNQTTRMLEHNLRGQPVRIQDPNGVVTLLEYHPRGWLEKRTVQSAAGNVVTAYTYDDAGLLKTMQAPNGVTLTYTYDTAHRLRTVTNNAGEKLTLTLDEFGNPSVREVRDASNSIQQLVRKDFDELGRLWKVVAPEGHEAEVYAYDKNSNPVQIANASGVPKIQAFDGFNRLTGIVDREQGNIQYEYDARNNLTKVTDQNNLETVYTVDGFGFKIQEASPDRGTIVKRYDPAGNMTEERSGRNVVTTYTYDALNRVKTLAIAGFAADGATYFYDETTTSGLPNKGIGKLTRITQNSGDAQSFLYDDRGNVTRVINKVGSVTQAIQYGYSLGSTLASITYPSGRIVTYTLDSLSRPRAVSTQENASATPSVVVSDVVYKPFGPISQLKYGNDLVLDKTYDQHYRIEDVNSHLGNASVLNLSYGYDTRGNIDSVTDRLEANQTQTLGYDDLSRLTSALGGYGTFDFNYDPVGNRETVNWNQGSANYAETYATQSTQTNQLDALQRTGSGAFSKDYNYSDSGNLTGDGTRTFEYDGRDRLIGVKQGATVIATYDHNTLGQRTRKTVTTDANSSRLFHYDLAGRLLVETKANGDPMRDYIYLNNQPLAAVDEEGGATPTEQTDIAVTLAGDNGLFAPDQANGGGTVAFIATVSNTSPSTAAAAVSLALSYPADVLLESITPSTGSCNSAGTSCTLGALASGASATVRTVVRQAQPADKSYTATVTTSTAETSTDNNTATSAFGRASGCFIATAAFGSYAHPYLHVLRDFRDDILMQNEAGRRFVDFYYRNSPPLADWIAQHDTARSITRVLLMPLIALAAFLQLPLWGQGLILLAFATLVVVWKKLLLGSMLKAAIKAATAKTVEVLFTTGKAVASKSSAVNLKTWMLGALLYFVLVAPSVGWADTLYYIHSDNLNTPKVMTNQARQVVWKGQYEPFGTVKEPVKAVENNLRFPGQYHDRETGLYYNYFRDYDSSIGRYVQADPIGLLGGENVFIYVAANPIRFTDFYGLEIYDTYSECMNAASAYLSSCLNGARELYDYMLDQFNRTCQISCGGFGNDYGGYASCIILCDASLGPAKSLTYLLYMSTVSSCYGFYQALVSMCDRSRDCRSRSR